MKLSETIKEFFLSVLEQLELAWWVEIVTHQPQCTYYFGPFSSVQLARAAQAGYIEDLEYEEVQGITVNIKRCQPQELTIFEDE